ncbi:diguanylate cyclase domain-containing protein, partial [Leptospira sp. SA-E8]|uniref:diguanylate cyclase domain-containing protein n=1 Tax=Leptospira sp. SA-E8 TaxID=3422259 RepID=UPI003EB7BEC1
MRESEERLSTILGSVEAYIYIKDRDLRYEYANRRVCELLGRPLDEILGRTDEDFFDAMTVRKLRVNDARVIERGERGAAEEINTSQDGSVTRTYLSIKLPLRREDGSIHALCGISTDITDRKAAEEEIQRLAFYDPLTGLPNRRLMMDRLQHALASHARQAHTGALLFIDLDHFKVLNDTLGHDMGDQWLREVEQRLSVLVRKGDTLA